MSVSQFGRICVCLGAVVLLLAVLPIASSTNNATGRFEVYCDGVGIFLANIDGEPAPGKLVLLSIMGFPPGTMGGRYFGQGKWSNVYVYRDGCVPDGKCESIARGKIWIDDSDTSETGNTEAKRISGKYEIDLNGKHLEGPFVAKRRDRKHALRLCM
jgi:hypothetical protein